MTTINDVHGFARVDRLITTMVASALESGMGHSQAVTLSIATFKEVELLIRNQNFDPLPEPALDKVHTFCCAILASGTTFSPFMIAQQAVMAAKATEQGLEGLKDSWNPVGVEERPKRGSRKNITTLTSSKCPGCGSSAGFAAYGMKGNDTILTMTRFRSIEDGLLRCMVCHQHVGPSGAD